MNVRIRKLIGAAALVIGLTIYALAAMRLAVAIVPEHWLAQLAYAIVAGIAWVFPIRRFIYWMNGG
jgi:hypothetical protein